MIVCHIKCSICGKPIVGRVHTSTPVKEGGLCCHECFISIVRPRVNHFINSVLNGSVLDERELYEVPEDKSRDLQ
jgi:hypothetical protein